MSDGIAREGFDRDLRHGEAREDAFVHVLLRSRVEVKSDGKCATTGNVFIEYRQHGRPSGIATTEASWYVIEVCPDRWVMVTTPEMKSIAARAIREGRWTMGGDGNHYKGALVPREWLTAPVRAADP